MKAVVLGTGEIVDLPAHELSPGQVARLRARQYRQEYVGRPSRRCRSCQWWNKLAQQLVMIVGIFGIGAVVLMAASNFITVRLG